MTEQPNFPILEWGIVLCPSDPDIVSELRYDYEHGDMTIEEFERRLEEVMWEPERLSDTGDNSRP